MQVSFDLNCCLFDVSQVQDQLFAKSALTSQIPNLVQGREMPPRREVGPLSALALNQVKPLVK